jgi:hypothetical protein
MGRLARFAAASLGGAALVVGTAVPASAFHCTNPQRNANAPHAGVNYMLTGFDPVTEEPILEQVGSGTGLGGWVAVAPGVFGNPEVVYTSPHNVLGGPGSAKPEHMCDGKGIDYLECFLPEEP